MQIRQGKPPFTCAARHKKIVGAWLWGVGLRVIVYVYCICKDFRYKKFFVATRRLAWPEPVLLNVYGAPELIPRNEFGQPM
jgi:hypothetical protein